MRKILFTFILFPLLTYASDVKCLLPEGTRFELLIKSGQLDNPYHLFIGPRHELYLLTGTACMNFFNTNAPTFAFPPSFKITGLSWMDSGDCLFSDSSSLYYRNEECDTVLTLLSTEMNDIHFDSSQYGIYYYDSKGSELRFFSYPKAEATTICKFPNPISSIAVLDENCFIAYGGNVCMISKNQEYVSLFKIKSTVTSLAIGCEGDLFYGTSDGLFYYNGQDCQYPIINNGVQELLIDGDNLYIIFSDWSSARIEGVPAYRKIADSIIKKKESENKTLERGELCLSNGEIEQALQLYNATIESEKEKRQTGKGVSGDLLAEFSYALALHHDFEAALINIDRARMVGTKYGDFYAAQVLTLMGYSEVSQQLMKQAKVPEWINDTYQGLNEKYKATVSINRDAPEVALKRANKLAANRQTIQAMALFEELAMLYPDTYIIYVDYSTVWENLGYYAYAAQLLQKGIDLMPQEQSRNKQIFQNHLAKVNQMKATSENASWMKRILGMNPPKLMTYVGASAAKDMYSLNGRMGLYTSNKFSASVNVGLNYASEQFSGSIGVSGYKAWGIFVGGLGITDMFGKDTNTFSLTPSIGLSFLNKSQTSSFDIMVNGYIPFSSEQKFSYSISVGKTIYFDLNGLLK